MKKLVVVLFLIAICCLACSSPSAQVSSTVEAIPPLSSQTYNDEPSSSSGQEEASVASDVSATPNYQGLTQGQWQRLQDQKELYGDLTSFEKSNAQFNGTIDCANFIHLAWEHPISMELIDYVGVDEFEAWTRELREDADPNQWMSIYSFAKHFSIELDELLLLITHAYDLDTVKRRYEYFTSNLHEEIEMPPTAPLYCQGLTQAQWDGLQAEKAEFESMTSLGQEGAREGARFGCFVFIHLWWEDFISIELVKQFAGDDFDKWIQEEGKSGKCTGIYSFAQYFSIDPEELIGFIEEENLTKIYDVETMRRRFEYFNSTTP